MTLATTVTILAYIIYFDRYFSADWHSDVTTFKIWSKHS